MIHISIFMTDVDLKCLSMEDETLYIALNDTFDYTVKINSIDTN